MISRASNTIEKGKGMDLDGARGVPGAAIQHARAMPKDIGVIWPRTVSLILATLPARAVTSSSPGREQSRHDRKRCARRWIKSLRVKGIAASET